MIDIHAHILPGVDDGADRLDTSVLMAQAAAESGVTDIIATPHCNQRRKYENYASEDLADRLFLVQAAVAHADVGVNVHPGMEVFGTPDVAELLRRGKLLTLAGSRYLLVEFAFRENPYFMERTVHSLMAEGVTPIVAHPERYDTLRALPVILFDWVRSGVHLQLNKASLSGGFGHGAQRMAHLLLQHDLVSFIASDAHGVYRRTPDLSQANEFVTMQFSYDRAARLMEENPKRILRDMDLLPCDPIPF